MLPTHHNDTICALSTAPGMGAIAVIRVSGPEAIALVNRLFSKDLGEAASHTAHYGTLTENGETLDEVVVTLYKGTRSFTGEDTVEVSCHGSVYIQQRILQALTNAGGRMAQPGEFSMRAFMNGKMDLSQTEAIADLIAARSKTAQQLALHQLKGGFSSEIKKLREELVNFASLIELELDFAEEDVEFANRDQLEQLLVKVLQVVTDLANSFSLGNVIKDGIPVAIVGVPNVGKSTLLNVLLREDRAIVSDIPGTTRDSIEDVMDIDGILFRFIDTAGIRDTGDEVELKGIERTFDKVRNADIILYLVDAHNTDKEEIEELVNRFSESLSPDKEFVVVANKMDKEDAGTHKFDGLENVCFISALKGEGIQELTDRLLSYHSLGMLESGSTIVTNARHYEALVNAKVALTSAQTALTSGLSQDLLAIDIRKALHHLSEIIGDVSTDDLLDNIFSKFCIGK